MHMSKGHPLVVTPNSSDECDENLDTSPQKANKYFKGINCLASLHDVTSIYQFILKEVYFYLLHCCCWEQLICAG